MNNKKLPKGLVKEEGHKYVMLECLKKDGKVIAKPGYIAIYRGFNKEIHGCYVEQIVKNIYLNGASEIQIWGDFAVCGSRRSVGSSVYCNWNSDDRKNDTFFIEPR